MTQSEAVAAKARCDAAVEGPWSSWHARYDLPSALADRERLIEAIKPLARAAEKFASFTQDFFWSDIGLGLGDCRRAADLLRELGVEV